MKNVNQKFRIAFAAHDAGGMNSLLPVFKKIKQDRRFEVLGFFSGPAKKIAEDKRLRFFNPEKYQIKQIKNMLLKFSPALIFTGTSSGIHIEKILLKIAREYNWTVVAILDFWINYNLQFSFNTAGTLLTADLPDYILVMDELAKKEMMRENFPAKRIVITGNPHFDSFKKLPVSKNKNTMLFIDQHFSELTKKGIHENMGYDELKVFPDLMKAIEKLNWQGKLTIKFHPGAKNLKRYDKFIANNIFPLSIEKAAAKEPLRKLFNQNYFVVGMTSVALFEAALGGKLVLSYQPGIKRKPDPLITNRLGLSHFAYSYSELVKKLKQILNFKKPIFSTCLANYYTKNQATKRVFDFIISLCQK